MKNKIVSADEAIAVIQSGDTFCNSGFVGNGTPDELLAALERRFLNIGAPRDLTLVFAAGQGDGKEKGLNRLGHDGLLKRVVGGHWGLIPKVAQLAMENKLEAYNLPQGVISHLYRDIAAGKPGVVTKVGMRTFVDPRNDGGRINASATEDLVQLITLNGEEWLFYKAFPINVAFLRGTTADPFGNISMERETLVLDNLAMAQAVKNSGGVVICQVERIAERNSLHPRLVEVPGVLVDCVVVAQPENHMQTYAVAYSPSFAHEIRVPLDSLDPMPLDERKVIARRAAMELPTNAVINLGIGMPEGVAAVANEENILSLVTLTAEPGVVGGVPQSGLNFGASVNTECLITQNQQFDFYDGGGLDLACLGMAEMDAAGNVNVSRFGPKLAGAGGFINISQNARRMVFVGTFTASGLVISIKDGRIVVDREGTARKCVRAVGHVTFSGPYAAERGQDVLYVTERCVFRLTEKGPELIEVAPGVDMDRDILDLMAFEPIVNRPTIMDRRIFLPKPMELRDDMLTVRLDDRIAYDADRNLLFLNFEGLHVRSQDDVNRIRLAVEEKCHAIGRKPRTVVNYDNFRLADDIAGPYVEMVKYMVETYYVGVSRYTTSAFMRLKLGEAMASRNMMPHIFETPDEARRWLINGELAQ